MVNKPAGANRQDEVDPASLGRIKQLRMAAGLVNRTNRWALPLCGLAVVGVIAVFVVVGLITGLVAFLTPLGVLLGLTAGMILFGRYAQSAQDVVHRAVGKPGVVLVGEGSPSRLPSLLAAEKKRVSRVAHDVPIYDFQVGDEEGQVPIRRLQRKLMRLPRNLKGPAVAELNYRLRALPANLQAPKGPMPKTGRMPKPPRPRFR